MDKTQSQFIRIRKQSLERRHRSKRYEDICSEDPFSIPWIAEEYRLVADFLPRPGRHESYANIALRMLDVHLKQEGSKRSAQYSLDQLTKKMISTVTKRLAKETVALPPVRSGGKKRNLSEKNFDEFVRLVSDRQYFTEARVCSWCGESSFLQLFLKRFSEKDEQLALAMDCTSYHACSLRVRSFLSRCGLHVERQINRALERHFTLERIYSLIKYNPNHNLFQLIAGREESGLRLRRILLERIPDSYVDLYPEARQIRRHFIIHHGPTNSGKTYGSVLRLKEAQNGVYAGPLRLLAYEIFDRLNKAGVFCRLRTGEEYIDMPEYTVTSSTVEMVNLNEEYDIVVVDEAQLVADPFRGGSWTRVILGVKAREIHLCCADEAVPILLRMIGDCGDDYELVAHERNTPLLMDERPFRFPQDVEPHDALIVFSRRDVHATAAELQDLGHSCSIIYGNLPYDVRHREAEKFTNGETELLVSTDAIGLGLNLPIKRIIFLRTEKFDGHRLRKLEPAEIKQIAGRAGRFGIFDRGLVNAPEDKDLIREGLATEMPELDYATIQFPETIIDIDAPMIDILHRWKDVTVNAGYRKADIEREIALCDLLKELEDEKYFLYKAITIPFDERSRDLQELWLDLVWAEHDGDTMIPEVLHGRLLHPDQRLDHLERAYHVCDMLYNFATKFSHEEYSEEIMYHKQRISGEIIRRLTLASQAAKKNTGSPEEE